MQKEQIKKRSAQEQQTSLVGPIFDKKPLDKKYLIGGLLLVVFLVVFFILRARDSREITEGNKESIAVISIEVARGDSYVKLSRKATTAFLAKYPEQSSLSVGQRIFIEEKLRRQLSGGLVIGEGVEFREDQIRTAIEQSYLLSGFQLHQWEKYAKGVRF